jgi:hypothetical protein
VVVMRAVVVSLVLLAGCRAGFKSSAGAATSPDGMGKGVSRSVVFSDQGGILSRAPLAALGMVAAAGAVKVTSDRTTVTPHGDGTATVEREISGTVDTRAAQNAVDLANANPTVTSSDGTSRAGLAANLEIASRSLGGDTSGWQFDFGFGIQRIKRHYFSNGFGLGWRGYLGLGYGNFSFHDRVMDAADRGPPVFGDGNYKFVGVPARFGVFVARMPGGLASILGTETYAKANLNSSGPSTFAVGQRVQWSLVFVEVETLMSAEDRGYGLELGFGF